MATALGKNKNGVTMKKLIKNLKGELKLRETQLKDAKRNELVNFEIDRLKGQIYALKTAIIFAEEGVDSSTIVRYGKFVD